MTALYMTMTEKIEELVEEEASIDVFFALVSWGLLMIMGIMLYVFLVTSVLPRILLSPAKSRGETADRGVKKYRFPEGRAVLYEPELKYRKYVSKYLLYELGGIKYVKFKIGEAVKTVECELAVYDNGGRLVKVMTVFLHTNKARETHAVELPAEASYARVIVRGANGIEVSPEAAAQYSFTKWAVFAGITTALTVIVGYFLRILLVFLGEQLFDYAEYATDYGFGFAFITSLVAGILISVLAAKLYCKKKIFKVFK